MKRIFQKMKFFLKVLLGKSFYIKPDSQRSKEKIGSIYGGWDIIVDKVNQNSIVYSFGVGEDISFDLALIEKFDLVIHAFDPTPKSIQWVKAQGDLKNFVLHEYGIASFDGQAVFFPPEDSSHVSHTIIDKPQTRENSIALPVKKLSTIMKDLDHHHIDILKMDIEGAEYDVLDDMQNFGIYPDQILVEFHHRFPTIGIEKTKEAITAIKSSGYELFSVSDSCEEFCFVRK